MAGDDPEYLSWVRGRPCLMAPHGPCTGPVDPHHARSHGMGKRAPDSTAVPLCRLHHTQWHAGSGPFKGWLKEERRAWSDVNIQRTQMAYAAQLLAEVDIPF